MRSTFILFVNLFFISSVFDPGDLLVGLKIPLFVLCFVFFLLDLLRNRNKKFPVSLLYINFTILFIPIVSFLLNLFSNSSIPSVGLDLYKGYIIITLSIFLYHFKYLAISSFSKILTVLSLLIITVYFVVTIYPELYNVIYLWGLKYQIFLIGERSYDPDVDSLWSIYFVTSPLLVIPIAYYIHLFYLNKNKLYLIFFLINVIAMFLAGTRNNMIVSIIVPVILFFYYTHSKLLVLIVSMSLFGSVLYFNVDIIQAMFSLNEPSNETKFGLLSDYAKIFSDPITLLFGQGLGSDHFWESRGKFYFITELTYLEIYRNFGLIMGAFLNVLILLPIFFFYFKKYTKDYFYLILAYFFYLIMSATNPIFFMSMGMIFFSIILSVLFSLMYSNTREIPSCI